MCREPPEAESMGERRTYIIGDQTGIEMVQDPALKTVGPQGFPAVAS